MVDKEKKMIFGIGIVFLFLATVTFSYAYFTATLVNNNVKDQVVQTGTLELTYTDGPEIVMNNIKPGNTITKEISVKNTGTLDTSYNLVWKELINEITNDEMVIEATCTRLNSSGVEEGTCESLSSTPIKRIKIKENVLVESNITHKYNITITFKETNAEQNYNQGKNFTGTLGINEYVDNTPIYCTFDGEMVQGAEYVNGQYTYRYKQKGAYSSSDLSWTNIEEDGWGVQLTDKTSTEPVTSKLCTHINNKPVTSMSYMFAGSEASTIDLSSFNTSNVTNMKGMFYGSRGFLGPMNSINNYNEIGNGNIVQMASVSDETLNLDLNNFEISKVINMKEMFYEPGEFIESVNNINNLNKYNVIDNISSIQEIAVGDKGLILDLINFDTSNVTNMSEMFAWNEATTIDLSSFDTSNVTDMNDMFRISAATTLDLSSFNTSNVTDMSGMFLSSAVKNLNLSNFDTSKVTNMSNMFDSSAYATLDLSSFDTSNVTDMTAMFASCEATTLDVSSFDTSNVTNMNSMFHNSAATTLNLSNFDTRKVTNMSNMFDSSAATILDLSSFDTSKVTDMSGMFRWSKATTLDLSNFDTSKVTDMREMFYNCNNLKTIYASDKFNTNSITSSYTYNMFKGSSNLVGGAGTTYNSSYVDKTYARIDGGTSSPGYFTLKNN